MIIILEKFKNYLQELRLKFDSQIDHKYRQQLINLENDYKEVRNLKQINENIAESQQIISGNEIQNKSQVLIDSDKDIFGLRSGPQNKSQNKDNNRFEYDYQTHYKENKLSNSCNVSNKLQLELEKTLTLVL